MLYPSSSAAKQLNITKKSAIHHTATTTTTKICRHFLLCLLSFVELLWWNLKFFESEIHKWNGICSMVPFRIFLVRHRWVCVIVYKIYIYICLWECTGFFSFSSHYLRLVHQLNCRFGRRRWTAKESTCSIKVFVLTASLNEKEGDGIYRIDIAIFRFHYISIAHSHWLIINNDVFKLYNYLFFN